MPLVSTVNRLLTSEYPGRSLRSTVAVLLCRGRFPSDQRQVHQAFDLQRDSAALRGDCAVDD